MSERDEIVVATVEEPGGLRKIGGVRRISGTELGRLLEYDVKHPTNFNRRVIEKLLKEGKLNNSDIVADRQQCKKGFGFVPVTEYWLTHSVARSIALEHVWTPQAVKLRKQVVEQLETLMGEKPEALQAPTADYAALTLAVQETTRVLEKHSALLQTLAQPQQAPSIFASEECIHLVKCLAQELAEVRGEGSVQSIWQTLRVKHSLTKARKGKRARLFDTVTLDRYDAVLAELRADLVKARNAPNKVVPLARRASTEKSVDVDCVAKRLKVMLSNLDEKDRVEVPAHALPAIYRLASVEVYDDPTSEKADDTRILESQILDVGTWCAKNAKGLKFLLKELVELHRFRLKARASGRRRGVTGGE